MIDRLWERFVGDATGPERQYRGQWADVLIKLYTGPDRHYHALRHIDDLLQRLDALPKDWSSDEDRRIIELSVWFHDAIYCVPSFDNEGQSALLAEAFLAQTEAARDAAPVRLAIIATRHTGTDPGSYAARIMCDLDMAGFADAWDDFSANNARIREEYRIYSDEDYVRGRVAFLRGLLARERIYYELTELEAPARANIERHIAELSG